MNIVVNKLLSQDGENGGRATVNFYGKGGYLIRSVDLAGKVSTGPYIKRVDINPEIVKSHSVVTSDQFEYKVQP